MGALAKKKAPQSFQLVIAHPSVTQDTTTAEFKTHPNRKLKITKVEYVNDTGLAASATDYFAVQLKTAATVLAAWSTLNSAQGALVAGTFHNMVLNVTPTNLVLPAGSPLSLLLDETGTQTLPAGKLIVHGEYL